MYFSQYNSLVPVEGYNGLFVPCNLISHNFMYERNQLLNFLCGCLYDQYRIELLVNHKHFTTSLPLFVHVWRATLTHTLLYGCFFLYPPPWSFDDDLDRALRHHWFFPTVHKSVLIDSCWTRQNAGRRNGNDGSNEREAEEWRHKSTALSQTKDFIKRHSLNPLLILVWVSVPLIDAAQKDILVFLILCRIHDPPS